MNILPIWPSIPSESFLSALKEAKQQIPDAPLVTPVRAVYQSPGRVLAIGQPPDFICDYALVKEDASIDSIRQALEWVFELNEDERGMTILKKMQQIFGPETREVTNEHDD